MSQIQHGQDFNFSPIENGVDYLHSAVDLLLIHEADPSPRNLKYVILHLHAAVEVLLKHRLLQEGWEHVFENPEEASHEKYVLSDFRSVSVNEAIKRLRNEANVQIKSRDKKALGRLTKKRNALQHWGYNDSVVAVEKQTLKVLEFLMSFLYSELLEELDTSERDLIDEEIESIKQGTREIKGFIDERKKRVEPEIDAAKEEQKLVLDCPDCLEHFLVSYDTENKCLLCPKDWEVADLLNSYMEDVLSVSDYSIIKDGDKDPRKHCPECQDFSLLVAGFISDSGEPLDLCFTCGLTFTGFDECWDCLELFTPEEGEVICISCFRNRVEYD